LNSKHVATRACAHVFAAAIFLLLDAMKPHEALGFLARHHALTDPGPDWLAVKA
jgi:hypothetical protein